MAIGSGRQLVGVFISDSHCVQTAMAAPSCVFTAMVAPRCDRLHAVPASPAAQVHRPTPHDLVPVGQMEVLVVGDRRIDVSREDRYTAAYLDRNLG
jgi:hypothetical protein